MMARMFKSASAAALLLAGLASSPALAADYHEPVYQEPVYQETYSPPQPVYQPPVVYQQPVVYQPPVYQPVSCCGGCNRGLFTRVTVQAPCNYAPQPQYQPYPQYQAYPQYQPVPQYQEDALYEEEYQDGPQVRAYPAPYPRYQRAHAPSYRYAPRVAVRTAIFPQRRMINPRPAQPHCSMVRGHWACR